MFHEEETTCFTIYKQSFPRMLLFIQVILTACFAKFWVPTLHSHRFPQMNIPRPTLIAHRGASAYRPEHTIAGYQLAIDQGADIIEPDLVITKDGILIVRHENELTETTNVADHPEFASRKTRKNIDGIEKEGWFAEDFTLQEIKTLRAKERIPQYRPANTLYDNQYEIATFQQVIDLMKKVNSDPARKRTIGIYPGKSSYTTI